MPRVAARLAPELPAPSIQHMYRLAPLYLLGDLDVPGLRKRNSVSGLFNPALLERGGRSMAQEDAHGAIVVWHPSPDRRRLVLRWTIRCVVAGALVAGAWPLRDRYPRIDLSGTGAAKQVQATRAHVDQPVPVAVSAPKESTVVTEPPKKPPVEWRPPLDTRSVVRTIPSE